MDDITDPTSSIITPDVIKAYSKCGGDFAEAIPFCLLRAKATFLRDANRNRESFGAVTMSSILAELISTHVAADYDENLCRCERNLPILLIYL